MAMYGFDWRVLHFTTQPSAVILSHSQLQLPKHIKLLEAACSFLHNDISAVSKIYAFICMPQDQGSRIIDICIIHTYMHHTHIHQDQESLIYASIHTCIINTGVIDTCIVDTCIIDTCIMDTCISVSCSMLHPTQRFPIQSIHPLIAYATAFLNLKFFAEHPI